MRTKSFLLFLCSVVTVLVLIILGQQKPASLQDIINTTHQQIKNFTKDTLRDRDSKTFVSDSKYLTPIGLSENARLYPQNVWPNSSLPVFVTYVMEGQESQAVGMINNITRILPNNTILVYNLGLGNYGLRTMLNYCNNTRCQVITFSLNNYPSHVQEDSLHAYRPLIIQDALQRTGAVFFLECNRRFRKNISAEKLTKLFETTIKGDGVQAWPMVSKIPVSSVTHKKMFEYFHTDAESFLFVPMMSGEIFLIFNTESNHKQVMLPWVQCAITQDCIIPIGAQSGGCRFDKKPQYRYSGCHSYDTSALNIVLGLRFKLDGSRYCYKGNKMFTTVLLEEANAVLKGLEQNTTTEGRTSIVDAF
ncbi:uncharacterized protein [Onthophagus taurus]|uniref:uncharacterized protein n=1 Tax=Onthophagus taurus TaxID=166361 RepID=UPI000C204DD3|nr:uncharacterized protein LOC111427450 [Onthophagus taurus]